MMCHRIGLPPISIIGGPQVRLFGDARAEAASRITAFMPPPAAARPRRRRSPAATARPAGAGKVGRCRAVAQEGIQHLLVAPALVEPRAQQAIQRQRVLTLRRALDQQVERALASPRAYAICRAHRPPASACSISPRCSPAGCSARLVLGPVRWPSPAGPAAPADTRRRREETLARAPAPAARRGIRRPAPWPAARTSGRTVPHRPARCSKRERRVSPSALRPGTSPALDRRGHIKRPRSRRRGRRGQRRARRPRRCARGRRGPASVTTGTPIQSASQVLAPPVIGAVSSTMSKLL